MRFAEDHGLRIGDQIMYETQSKGERAPGTVVGLYPHFVMVQSAAGYITSVSNADLYVQYGWD